jgi:acetyltransferase-like isoleucine patch superfamily enzyme
MNTIKRGMSLMFAENGSIGNRNVILRGWSPSPVEPALLRLGVWAKITSEHYVEMTRSVRLGDYATVAGVRTQFWTHGFVHAEKGLDRALVVGKIIVGDNVYIGSGSVVTCGVRIADAVTLGVATSVVKSLDKPGLYAAQPLRWFDRDSKSRLAALAHVEGPTPQDSYYRRDP